jgi:thymidine kinase
MAKLYFRYGTVGSAKTLNLIAVAHNYVQQVCYHFLSYSSIVVLRSPPPSSDIPLLIILSLHSHPQLIHTSQGKAVVIAKPAVDTRFGRERVASRAQLSKQATIIIDDNTVIDPKHFKNIHCLVVDEVQFLHPKFIDLFREIADLGCPVICYGLRTDFRRCLFDGTRRLLELADTIEEVKTTCYYCNKKAIFNLKLVNGKGSLSGAQVELGCEELYLPTCTGHFTEKTKDDVIVDDDGIVVGEEGSKIIQTNPGLSTKNETHMNIDQLSQQSRDKILELRRAIGKDNGEDPQTINDDYIDPLEN